MLLLPLVTVGSCLRYIYSHCFCLRNVSMSYMHMNVKICGFGLLLKNNIV